MDTTEHIRFRIPVPPGKRLAGRELRLMSFELDTPADAGRLTLTGVADWVEAKVRAALGEQPGYVILIELRPDAPTTVAARVLVPTFA
jgi:hypothetical protein